MSSISTFPPTAEPETLAAEARGLKATILALREQLEASQRMAVEEAQAARRVAQGEIAELRATVWRLREELEAQKASRDEALETLSRSRARDIAQLQDTIIAMRTALENHGR